MSMVDLPLFIGRLRSAMTCSFDSTVSPSRSPCGWPRTTTALARGCPENASSCAASSGMYTVLTPKLYRRSSVMPTDLLAPAADVDGVADVDVELAVDDHLPGLRSRRDRR